MEENMHFKNIYVRYIPNNRLVREQGGGRGLAVILFSYKR